MAPYDGFRPKSLLQTPSLQTHSRRDRKQCSGSPECLLIALEQRALVLDYLCHSSYTDTARAFVRDSTIKHLDADGDELMTPATSDGGSGDPLADTLDESLALAEIRRGMSA